MALARRLEPEVMDTPEEASDYDAMDHAEVNGRFCDDFLAVCGDAVVRRIVDVGTGTARIPIELCRRRAEWVVCAVDLAVHMLALAARNVDGAGLRDRVGLERRDAKATGWSDGAFDAVVSNSIVHHIPEPGSALREMWRILRPGGVLFVRDLARPPSDARVRELVATYAPLPEGGEASGAEDAGQDGLAAAVHVRQRALFEASLRAALTAGEVAGLVAPLGVPPSAVRPTSDRHWTLAHRKPGAKEA